MQVIVGIFIAVFGLMQSQSSSSHIKTLLDLAVKQDKVAFGSDYLHEAFTKWQDRFQIRDFKIDSIFTQGELEEVWLKPGYTVDHTDAGVALLVSRLPGHKIIDIRNLLLRHYDGLGAIDKELVAFVERFTWLYEIGNDSFLEDFLFPGHISIRYAGIEDQKDVLQNLRNKFDAILPVKSLEWESHGTKYLIQVILDSPLRPLEITVDIQKYIASRFFDSVERAEKIRALRDTLYPIQERLPLEKSSEALVVETHTAEKALEKALDLYFKNYDVLVLKKKQGNITIEARLPSIEKLVPTSLRYSLTVVPMKTNANKYVLQPIWVPNKDLIRIMAESDEWNKRENELSLPDSLLITELLNQMVQSYNTFNLPDNFRPQINVSSEFQAIILLQHTETDSIFYDNKNSFFKAMSKLALDKVAYFFLRNVTSPANRLPIEGYAIWREQTQIFQHVAKIKESYTIQNGQSYLNEVVIDINPYIRIENVKALFSIDMGGSTTREKIEIEK